MQRCWVVGEGGGGGAREAGSGRREVREMSEEEEAASDVGRKWKSPRSRSAHLLE